MKKYHNIVITIVRREFLLTWRKPAEWINPLLFILLVVTLFSLSMNPDPKILQNIGPSILWVAVLLAVLWSLNRLFQPDFEDGTLEQWLLCPYPFSLLIFVKLLAHWLMLVIPLLMMTPLLGLMLHLNSEMIIILLITFLMATPLLILIGAICTAILVGLRHNGLLLALILLPLYIPVLILTTGAINLVADGYSPAAPLAWLGCLMIFALISAPFVTAFSLRIGIAYR